MTSSAVHESAAREPAGRAARLLAWYDRVKRPLPWRETSEPYGVWISEIMLQQTRVETAIPYYERFIAAFPSVDTLAAASAAQVRALWSGLGYYRRAEQLHEAARRVSAARAFPTTLEGWLALPGVGPYTAAAVMSIVHGARVAALDGNLERVLARIEAYSENPKTAAGRRVLEQAAQSWLDHERPGDSNQALMEVGATVCRPKNPRCGQCPLDRECSALRLGRPEEFPWRRRRPKVIDRELLAVAVRRTDRFLLFRRDDDSHLLAGTWELPWVEGAAPDPASALRERYGGEWRLGELRGAVRHSITHRLLRVSIREGELIGGGSLEEGPEARWADLVELDLLPHSSLVRKTMVATLAAGK